MLFIFFVSGAYTTRKHKNTLSIQQQTISMMDFNHLMKQRCIDLINMKLHDGDLEVLTKVLQQSTVLQTLLLCKNNLTFANGRFIKALAHNKTLLTLNVSSNQISNEAAKLFADALKVLNNVSKYYTLVRIISAVSVHNDWLLLLQGIQVYRRSI